jgi:hypothetical protein
VIPELPEINSGFASCYPKFPNKIRVSVISGSGSGISGSGFGLRIFCPALSTEHGNTSLQARRVARGAAVALPGSGTRPSARTRGARTPGAAAPGGTTWPGDQARPREVAAADWRLAGPIRTTGTVARAVSSRLRSNSRRARLRR